MAEYDLTVTHAITDNASSMKKAFKLHLGEGDDENEVESDDEDTSEEADAVTVEIPTVRLSCFAHSLQLAVGDGLKENTVSCSMLCCVCMYVSMQLTSLSKLCRELLT